MYTKKLTKKTENQKTNVIEVVINDCFGGFNISCVCAKLLVEYGVKTKEPDKTCYDPKHVDFMRRLIGADWTPELGMVMDWAASNENRSSPLLVKAVKGLGSTVASGKCAELKIVEVPSNVKWTVTEYDGLETVEEVHQTWR
jgi:hypothetical protein